MITGTLPCLETPEGTFCESGAIARYFGRLNPEKHLNGVNNFEAALVDQWVDFNTGTIGPNLMTCMIATFGWAPVEKANYDSAIKSLKTAATLLNTHLAGKDFLVGQQLTVADTILGTYLSLAF
jgi:glutathione S-transferase